jgi:hypothetical protein
MQRPFVEPRLRPAAGLVESPDGACTHPANMKPLLTSLLALPLFACAVPSASVGVHTGQYSMDGSLGLSAAGSGGTVDATTSFDGLGLGDDSSSLGADVVLNMGAPTLILSAVQTDFKGSGTLTGDLVVGDVTLVDESKVDSILDVNLYQAFTLFELIPGDMINFALGLGANVIDFDGSFTGETTGGTEDTLVLNQLVPLPVVGARAAITLGPVDVSAFVTGMTFDFDDVEVSTLDIDLRAAMDLFGPMGAFIGYRENSIDVEYVDGTDAGKLDFSIGGPYLGLRASF